MNDKLGIGEELERQMQHVVDTYQDEWASVVQVCVMSRRRRPRWWVSPSPAPVTSSFSLVAVEAWGLHRSVLFLVVYLDECLVCWRAR